MTYLADTSSSNDLSDGYVHAQMTYLTHMATHQTTYLTHTAAHKTTNLTHMAIKK